MPDTRVNAQSHLWTFDEEFGKRTGTTVWLIESLGGPITFAEALAAMDVDTGDELPVRGQSFPGTSGVPCIKRSPRYVENTGRTAVLLTCEYDSTRNATLSPLTEPAKISSTGEQREESYYEDKTTPTPKLARMTNNRPFDELPKRDTSIRVYTIERNVAATTTDATVAALENKVNSGAVTISGRSWPAKTLKIGVVSLSETMTENGVNYKRLSGTIRGNPDGWTQKYESLGVVDINGDPVPDAKGNPVEEPWPLQANGTPAASAATKGAEITLEPYAAIGSFAPLL